MDEYHTYTEKYLLPSFSIPHPVLPRHLRSKKMERQATRLSRRGSDIVSFSVTSPARGRHGEAGRGWRKAMAQEQGRGQFGWAREP
eukprot:803093-Amorphochlora_amoeboformis.AAC.1